MDFIDMLLEICSDIDNFDTSTLIREELEDMTFNELADQILDQQQLIWHVRDKLNILLMEGGCHDHRNN